MIRLFFIKNKFKNQKLVNNDKKILEKYTNIAPGIILLSILYELILFNKSSIYPISFQLKRHSVTTKYAVPKK